MDRVRIKGKLFSGSQLNQVYDPYVVRFMKQGTIDLSLEWVVMRRGWVLKAVGGVGLPMISLCRHLSKKHERIASADVGEGGACLRPIASM